VVAQGPAVVLGVGGFDAVGVELFGQVQDLGDAGGGRLVAWMLICT